MATIFIKEALLEREINRIKKEFPKYNLLFSTNKESNLKDIEIVYARELSLQESSLMPSLQWVHSTTASLDAIEIDKTISKNNILLTSTIEENHEQSAEFALGALLNFAKEVPVLKNLTSSKTTSKNIETEKIWFLKQKTILQIGLGPIGKSISKYSKLMGMRVLGAENNKSFSPYCDKTFSITNLHPVIPNCDIISISSFKNPSFKYFFNKDLLDLTKTGSIILITGVNKVVDEKYLATLLKTGKFKGVFIDYYENYSKIKTSPLSSFSECLLTPHISSNPKSYNYKSFSTFLFNLRYFYHGNYSGMKNIINANTPPSTLLTI